MPLQLSGTVNPAGASSKTIVWREESELVPPASRKTTADVLFDRDTATLVAQDTGVFVVWAEVANGWRGEINTGFGPTEALIPYRQEFTIRIHPYITNELNLRANPGGRVSSGGIRQVAGGEVINITATADDGYIFSGWSSTNGGVFPCPSLLLP
jgi:hypothetical protein